MHSTLPPLQAIADTIDVAKRHLESLVLVAPEATRLSVSGLGADGHFYRVSYSRDVHMNDIHVEVVHK